SMHALLTPACECETKTEYHHQQRYGADVDELGPELKRFTFNPQILAQFLEIAFGVGRLLAEIFDFGLLLGRQYRALRAAALFLQRGKLLLRLHEAVLELLDPSEIALLRARFHALNDRQRPRERGAAAQ